MSDAINKPAHYNQGPIECIDAMQQILTPEEFRGFLKGNAFKYLWREKGKNGIEDLRKGKDYYDRLIQSFDESEAEQLATGEVATEVTGEVTGEVKPPDGWRWLELGEVFRKGDTTNTIEPIPEHWVGTQCVVKHVALRRNRFEVGEKVVHGFGDRQSISVIKNILGDGWVDLVRDGVSIRDGVSTAYHVKDLSPYIEDAK